MVWCCGLVWCGIEERDLAGEDFLQFRQCNQLSIMNTCFQKKPIHYGTWMHPAIKLHIISDDIWSKDVLS